MRGITRVVVAMLALAGCRGEHQGPGTITEGHIPAADLAQRVASERAVQAALSPGAPAAPRSRSSSATCTSTRPSPPTRSCAACRCCRARARIRRPTPATSRATARRSTSGASTTTPRRSRRSTGRRRRNRSGSATRSPAIRRTPTSSRSSAGSGRRSARRPRRTTATRTSSSATPPTTACPTRPISALDDAPGRRVAPAAAALAAPPVPAPRLVEPPALLRLRPATRTRSSHTPICPDGVDTRQLPATAARRRRHARASCSRSSAQWGFDAIVIPHGTTWGFYTPPGSSWDKQLKGAQHDPERQTLIEIYSGHGNSEEYRAFARAIACDADGKPSCPEPTADYLPCCWQAGEIIRARCGDDPGRRVRAARRGRAQQLPAGGRRGPRHRARADGRGLAGLRPVPRLLPARLQLSARGARRSTRSRSPTSTTRPTPRRFRFGFIASSDNHTARPGTGYKEFARRLMTEATGATRRGLARQAARRAPKAPDGPVAFRSTPRNPPEGTQNFQILDFERQASFFLTGGLVAVHSPGRDRDASGTRSSGARCTAPAATASCCGSTS